MSNGRDISRNVSGNSSLSIAISIDIVKINTRRGDELSWNHNFMEGHVSFSFFHKVEILTFLINGKAVVFRDVAEGNNLSHLIPSSCQIRKLCRLSFPTFYTAGLSARNQPLNQSHSLSHRISSPFCWTHELVSFRSIFSGQNRSFWWSTLFQCFSTDLWFGQIAVSHYLSPTTLTIPWEI